MKKELKEINENRDPKLEKWKKIREDLENRISENLQKIKNTCESIKIYFQDNRKILWETFEDNKEDKFEESQCSIQKLARKDFKDLNDWVHFRICDNFEAIYRYNIEKLQKLTKNNYQDKLNACKKRIGDDVADLRRIISKYQNRFRDDFIKFKKQLKESSKPKNNIFLANQIELK